MSSASLEKMFECVTPSPFQPQRRRGRDAFSLRLMDLPADPTLSLQNLLLLNLCSGIPTTKGKTICWRAVSERPLLRLLLCVAAWIARWIFSCRKSDTAENGSNRWIANRFRQGKKRPMGAHDRHQLSCRWFTSSLPAPQDDHVFAFFTCDRETTVRLVTVGVREERKWTLVGLDTRSRNHLFGSTHFSTVTKRSVETTPLLWNATV